MPVERRLEVKKTLVLEFTLPGVKGWSLGGVERENAQLQEVRTTREHWTLTLDANNAIETANTLEELARTILNSIF
jgi:hypothetical protein